MTKKNILIIEDDSGVNQLLQTILNKNHLEAVSAFSGTEGLLQMNRQTFDLILLDLMLPGMSGESLIEEIRKTSLVPVIVISAKKDLEDKIQILRSGADDYITKPFNEDEVVARIEVQLRRFSQSDQGTIKTWREIQIDTKKMLVTVGGREIHLTNAEFDILKLLIQNPEKAYSKREIYEKIWKGVYVGDDNTISVHVSNLRKKIAKFSPEEYIKTIWGIGFMLV